MNIKLIAGLATLLIGVSACTTPTTYEVASVDTLSNVERYQAAVHAQASAKNVHVHWVNPPDENDLKKYTEDQAKDGKAELN